MGEAETRIGQKIQTRVSLTDLQRERLGVLEATPLFVGTRDVLVDKFGVCALYGGMAIMVGQDKKIAPMLADGVTKDMVVKGGQLVVGENPDLDFMVADFGEGIDELADTLQTKLGENYVVAVLVGSYPRVDVFDKASRLEVASVSDLKSSCRTLRDIAAALEVKEVLEDDWQLYFGTQFLENSTCPLICDRGGERFVLYAGEMGMGQAVRNKYTLYSFDNQCKLRDIGRIELAEVVAGEYAYGIGKLAFLSQLGMGMYDAGEREAIAAEVRDMAGRVRLDTKQRLSRGLTKLMNGDWVWTRNMCWDFGLMSWFSPTLDQRLIERGAEVGVWNRMTEGLGRLNDKSGTYVYEALGVMMDAMEVRDEAIRVKVVDEFMSNWQPGSMIGVAMVGGGNKIQV